MSYSKSEPANVPPAFIAVLLLALVVFSIGPLVLIIAGLIFLSLWFVRAKPFLIVFVAALGFVVGIFAYKHVYYWITYPIQEMWSFYSIALISGGVVDWFFSPGSFNAFWASMGAQISPKLSDHMAWIYTMPLGFLLGSMAYGSFFIIQSNPLAKIKHQDKAIKPHKSVSGVVNALGNQRKAHSDDGSIIGTDRFVKPVLLTDKQANEHVLVLGTTGSGKTVTISNIVESAINRGLPLIYIDGKGDYELAQRVQTYAIENDRPAWVFGMRGDSVCYDPLASGGYTSKKDRIIGIREWTEEHYKKLAEGYLQCVFKVLETLDIPSDLVSLSKHLDIKKLKSLVRESKSPHAADLMEMLNEQDQATKSIEGLIALIRNFTNSEIGHLFKPTEGVETLTLQKVLDQNGIAYFSLPALEFSEEAQTLGKLIINDLKATMGQQLASTNKKKTLYTIFDEFSVFAGEQVLNVINMGRSAGIHAVLSTQSLSDIASGRKDNADHFINQVVGNCNTFIMHRQNSPEDAETLASIIGTKPSLEYTAQVSQSEATHMGTVRRTRGFLAHPDEIKGLGKGEAFYYSKHTGKLKRIKARLSRIIKP